MQRITIFAEARRNKLYPAAEQFRSQSYLLSASIIIIRIVVNFAYQNGRGREESGGSASSPP